MFDKLIQINQATITAKASCFASERMNTGVWGLGARRKCTLLTVKLTGVSRLF